MRPITGRILFIKSSLFLFIFGLSAYMIMSCDEEKSKERSYPRVKTNPVTNITAKGATFNGDIFSLGSEPIIEHGFTWARYDTPDINNDDKTFLGPNTTGGVFKADIVTALAKDMEYYVRSFVKTAEHVVYGSPVKFISLGSGAPVVTGFRPDTAAWLDTLEITGKNFARDLTANIVRLNETECKVVAGTDTTLKVEISPKVSQVENTVSVDISGNRFNYDVKKFKLLSPVITGFSPAKAYWEDTIKIKGRHLRTLPRDPGNKITIGGFACKAISISDTLAVVKVPNELNVQKGQLKLSISGLDIYATIQFELLPPSFTYSPKNGTWGTKITLSGKLNGLASRNSISFTNGAGELNVLQNDIVTTSARSIVLKVPASLATPKTRITFKAEPFTFSATDTFRLNPPVITSFTPSSGIPGSAVSIKGKYFATGSYSNYDVYFGDVKAPIGPVTDSTILVNVPEGAPDVSYITVRAILQSVTSSTSFKVLSPSITGIAPLTAGFDDQVTITGLNFDSPIVYFGDYQAEVVSSGSTSIVVKVPNSLDSIPVPVIVKTGISSLIYRSKFTLAPPRITSVTPNGSVLAGSTVTITGTGFNPVVELNKLYWDIYPLIIQSTSKTQIVATLPYGLPRQTARMKILAGAYNRYSTQTITINSKWLKLASPRIRTSFEYGTYVGMKVHSGVINNLGYVISEGEGVTYQFNPVGNVWTTLSAPSPFGGQVYDQMADAVADNKLFLLGGHYNGAMMGFDPSDGQWHNYTPPAQQSGVAFSLLNKLYFGLDYWFSYLGNPPFYESDPANGYAWVNKGNFPGQDHLAPSGYFTIGDYGYVVFYDNSVYQFSPFDFQWRRMADFPGLRRVMAFSFVLDGKAYFGGGRTEDWGQTPYSDVWTYDPVTNTWSGILYIPGERHSATAFTIGSKAYVGFGLGIETYGTLPNMYDFYEFDPAYPAK
jgi:hypothetical protein